VVLHWAAPAPGALRTPGNEVAPAVVFTVVTLVAILLPILRSARYWYLPQFLSGAVTFGLLHGWVLLFRCQFVADKGRSNVPFAAIVLVASANSNLSSKQVAR